MSRVDRGDVFVVNPFEVHSGASRSPGTVFDTYYLPRPTRARQGTDTVGDLQVRTDVLRRGSGTQDALHALSHPRSSTDDKWSAIHDLVEMCEVAERLESSRQPPWIPPLQDAVRQVGSLSLATGQLAEQAGVHPSHLIRVFKELFGLTPQVYLRQVRVAAAQDLIVAGHALADVANAVGFSDQAHLTREFKKVFGIPPGSLSRVARA